jgi:hypothetical protein
MRLVELFDRPYPLQWDRSDPRDVTAYFRTGAGNRVLVSFIELGKGVTEINFVIEMEDPKTGYHLRTFDLTGTGDAPRVLATVVSAMQEHVMDRRPDYLWFSTKVGETSRIRLYDAMVRRLLRSSGAYELLPSSRWDELPDDVLALIQTQVRGFRGWLFRSRRLTKSTD